MLYIFVSQFSIRYIYRLEMGHERQLHLIYCAYFMCHFFMFFLLLLLDTLSMYITNRVYVHVYIDHVCIFPSQCVAMCRYDPKIRNLRQCQYEISDKTWLVWPCVRWVLINNCSVLLTDCIICKSNEQRNRIRYLGDSFRQKPSWLHGQRYLLSLKLYNIYDGEFNKWTQIFGTTRIVFYCAIPVCSAICIYWIFCGIAALCIPFQVKINSIHFHLFCYHKDDLCVCDSWSVYVVVRFFFIFILNQL